jgi:hypothetical protein
MRIGRNSKPSTDLRSAITTTVDRFTNEGWQPECAPDYGFVFLNRNGTRRLLILTERDPFDATPQTFSPWSSIGPGRSGSMPSPGDGESEAVTPTRLPDFGRSRPSIRCDVVSQAIH